MWNIHKLKAGKTLSTNKFQGHLASRRFTLSLWYQQFCKAIVEITDIKCSLLSKHFFKDRCKMALAPKLWIKIICIKNIFQLSHGIKKNSQKQVVSVIQTLEKDFFAAATSKGFRHVSKRRVEQVDSVHGKKI